METLLIELGNDHLCDSELLSVHLTKAEHRAVVGALNRVLCLTVGRSSREALEGLIGAFEDNLESWEELQEMKL